MSQKNLHFRKAIPTNYTRTMKKHRYNCVVCGTGFNALSVEETRFCKKKCAKEWYGSAWMPGMFRGHESKTLTLEEKLIFAESL